ncbi:hypothetical protein DSUL_60319 [Desulfovibrionales bacterium]
MFSDSELCCVNNHRDLIVVNSKGQHLPYIYYSPVLGHMKIKFFLLVFIIRR